MRFEMLVGMFGPHKNNYDEKKKSNKPSFFIIKLENCLFVRFKIIWTLPFSFLALNVYINQLRHNEISLSIN